MKKEVIRSKKEIKMEQREKLLKSINKMKELWFSAKEIWELCGIKTQSVVWIRKKWTEYHISFDRAKKSNDILEKIISDKTWVK